MLVQEEMLMGQEERVRVAGTGTGGAVLSSMSWQGLEQLCISEREKIKIKICINHPNSISLLSKLMIARYKKKRHLTNSVS